MDVEMEENLEQKRHEFLALRAHTERGGSRQAARSLHVTGALGGRRVTVHRFLWGVTAEDA